MAAIDAHDCQDFIIKIGMFRRGNKREKTFKNEHAEHDNVNKPHPLFLQESFCGHKKYYGKKRADWNRKNDNLQDQAFWPAGRYS